eukprot:716761-Amorphochlora_amoeboformis.AAC.1
MIMLGIGVIVRVGLAQGFWAVESVRNSSQVVCDHDSNLRVRLDFGVELRGGRELKYEMDCIWVRIGVG